jgi:hypothetical protein
MGIIHPDSFDETMHIHGVHDGRLNYYDTVDSTVKPCADNPATISHTGTITQGTLVQITNIPPKARVDIPDMGLTRVDDGFLDINTDAALGDLIIKIKAPRYKPIEWELQVVTP